MRYAPQSRFPPHVHGAGEELLVLEGVVQDEHGRFEALVLDGGFTADGEAFERESWLRVPPSEPLLATTRESGVRVWIKTGHLSFAR